MEPTEPWTDVDQLFLVLYQQAFQQRVNWWAVTSSDYSRWAFGVLSEGQSDPLISCPPLSHHYARQT